MHHTRMHRSVRCIVQGAGKLSVIEPGPAFSSSIGRYLSQASQPVLSKTVFRPIPDPLNLRLVTLIPGLRGKCAVPLSGRSLERRVETCRTYGRLGPKENGRLALPDHDETGNVLTPVAKLTFV
jgi:hypothetical protein